MIKTASLCLWISGLGFGIPGIYGIWSVLKGKGIAYVMGFSTYGNGPFEKIGVHTTIPLLIVMLIIMNRIAENIRNDQRVDTNDIESIVDFLKTFADKCHHGKEENALFPALVEAGIPKEGGPIGVMLHEHAVGREYINEISTKTKQFKSGNSEALQLIADTLFSYINLLHAHIQKEENILFPMGEN